MRSVPVQDGERIDVWVDDGGGVVLDVVGTRTYDGPAYGWFTKLNDEETRRLIDALEAALQDIPR